MVAAADNQLGFDLYRQISAVPGNLVFSPHSIAAAMAMTLSGARGDTEREIATVLHIDLPAAEVAEAHHRMSEMFNRNAGANGPQVDVANALHLTTFGGLVSPAFQQLLASHFGAEVFNKSDLATINAWVRQRTHGRIERILERLDPLSVCVVLNAIYFKGAWEKQFDEKLTRDDDFRLTADRVAKVPTMHQVAAFNVVQTQTYEAIQLPYYKSDLSMVVVAPTHIDGLSDLETHFDAQLAGSILSGLSNQRIALSLPRFRIEFGADLISGFRSLGMRLAFIPGQADFGGVTQDPKDGRSIYISQIRHRAFIDVNEKGTEAAATTAVEQSTRLPARPIRIDRPFLYFMVDRESGAILFVGRVIDPRGVPDTGRGT